ncbi:glutathione peroxidase [Microbacterium sp. YY-03]|uniref:glutathione peroxidase n=1 Tax=Microbacterium sp. YY-03 TaxID=3421636 RepID=UPI003D16B170
MTDTTETPLRDIAFVDAAGNEHTLAEYRDNVVMIVNVASKCGLTPQYEQLEELQKTYGDRGFTVLGFPCNQFMGQEPGTMEEILDYCAVTWGVSFPINDKIKVNGRYAAPLYKALKKTKDADGKRGPVLWNFEKFVLTPDNTLHRFRPPVIPTDKAVVDVIEANLPR